MSKNRSFISENRLHRIAQVASQRQQGLTIVLEDVHDPHNAAAVLRTCDGFGVQNVHFVFVNQPEYNPAKIGKQSSSSAYKWLDFTIHKSIEDCYNDLHKENYEIWATVLDEDSIDLYTAEFTNKNIALVFGNEHTGLTQTALDLADKKLYLPMRGMVESLNISVTAAICLFEVTRQRIASGNSFTLKDTQRDALISSFKER